MTQLDSTRARCEGDTRRTAGSSPAGYITQTGERMNTDTKAAGLVGCAGTVLLGLFLSLCFGGCYGCSTLQVSDGYRDSTVRKMSETGLIWKTTEVEALGDGVIRNTNGQIGPETFYYSVTDPTVKAELSGLKPGERVRIHYKKMAAAWGPKGETPYFIVRVERL